MYKEIILDYLLGIYNSCHIKTFVTAVRTDNKLTSLIIKLIKFNLTWHFLPTLIILLLEYCFGIQLSIVSYPINLFSIIFHLIHYIDLVGTVSTKVSKSLNTMSMLEMITMAITMSIYQLMIYFTTKLINFVFHDRLYYLCIVLNFCILATYHSFYCYNNLWQYKQIDMLHRINIHEKLWPYYLGYGTISTIIYLYISYPFMAGIYNLYLVLIIALPFLIKRKIPSEEEKYPKINLIIFSYITGLAVYATKCVLKFIQ